WEAAVSEKPPLIVKSHGGPTSATAAGLDLSLQFWTSRGFAVLDVNYRGSSGFGRKYREKLHGQWGVADVADCIAGAKFLAGRGIPTCLMVFQGEKHGFRQSEHIRRALESELLFYAMNLLRIPLMS